MEQNTTNPKAKGGLARAEKLSKQERKSIASKAARARWEARKRELAKLEAGGMPEACNDGFLEIGEVKIECYVLNDRNQTRLISKRGMARALSLQSEGGNAFMKTMGGKKIGSILGENLRKIIDNPIVFKPLAGDPAHGYKATDLIEICDALWEAYREDKLLQSQEFLGIQAEIIIRSSAKVGIIALVDEATGFIHDKRRALYRELFQDFIREEFREWSKEFPDQLFDVFYKLYKLPRGKQGKHPQFFGKLIRKYIYMPLANSNGAILEMLDEKNPVVYQNGGRRYKMFQFLSNEIGMDSLRAHLWQIVGIGNACKSKESFERSFKNAFPEAGDQFELDL